VPVPADIAGQAGNSGHEGPTCHGGVVRVLSASSVYNEIFDNDAAFQLFCSIAASDESQGGWENGRIAALVPESCQDLAPKIARHGADEDKHGRIFRALLHKRGLEPVSVPDDTNYTMRLEDTGIGLAHTKLRRDERLTEQDIITYLAHSRVTEQRASEQMQALRKVAGSHEDLARAIRMISNDEDNHLAYCHEELLKMASAGYGPVIQEELRRSAMAEIGVYRDISKSVMGRIGRLLRWSGPKSAALAAGIQAIYAYDRLGGWRRMVSLRPPERRDALGGPATDAPTLALARE
jgi:rubrerythrin